METITVCYYIEESHSLVDASTSTSSNCDDGLYSNTTVPNAFQMLLSPTHPGTDNFHDNYYEVLLLDIVNFLKNYSCGGSNGDGNGLLAFPPSEYLFYALIPLQQDQGRRGLFQCISVPSLATCLCHSNQQSWRTHRQTVYMMLLRKPGIATAVGSTAATCTSNAAVTVSPNVHPYALTTYFYRQPLRLLPRPPKPKPKPPHTDTQMPNHQHHQCQQQQQQEQEQQWHRRTLALTPLSALQPTKPYAHKYAHAHYPQQQEQQQSQQSQTAAFESSSGSGSTVWRTDISNYDSSNCYDFDPFGTGTGTGTTTEIMASASGSTTATGVSAGLPPSSSVSVPMPVNNQSLPKDSKDHSITSTNNSSSSSSSSRNSSRPPAPGTGNSNRDGGSSNSSNSYISSSGVSASAGSTLFSSFMSTVTGVAGTVNATAQSTLSGLAGGLGGLSDSLSGVAASVSSGVSGKGMSSGLGLGLGLGALTLTQHGTRVQIDKELAEGGFSTVYLAHTLSDGGSGGGGGSLGSGQQLQQFALKQVKCQTPESVRAAAKELAMLQRFPTCPYILQQLDSCVLSNPSAGIRSTYFYLLPLFPEGSAWDGIEQFMNYTNSSGNHPNTSSNNNNNNSNSNSNNNSNWPFPESVALEIMIGVASALTTMHAAGFSHRDVKPHNILLQYNHRNSNNNISGSSVHPVLMDLGSVAAARNGPITSKAQAGDIEEEANANTSPAYKPPELVSVPYNAYTYSLIAPGISDPNPTIILDERVDVWSLGCVMFALAFGISPFESLSEGVKKLGILNARYSVPAYNLSPVPANPRYGGSSGSSSSDRHSSDHTAYSTSPLSMPPPLPPKTKRGAGTSGSTGTGTNTNSLERPSSAKPCQTQFSCEYVNLIASMLQLNYNDRPFAGTVRDQCQELLKAMMIQKQLQR